MPVVSRLDILGMEVMNTDVSIRVGLDIVGLVLAECEVSGCTAEGMAHRSIAEGEPATLVGSILFKIGG